MKLKIAASNNFSTLVVMGLIWILWEYVFKKLHM